MKSVWFRAAAIGVAALLLTAAYKRAEPSSVMADAANALLNSLWPDQKAKVSYAFDDDERLTWHFVPTGANYKPGDRELRKGMPLGAMQPFQRELATALLAAGLSQQGVIKAQSIMSLEQVLLILEGAKPVNRRDPDNYFITIFGTPSAKGTWGYRIEGHHLAQNYTIIDGKVSDSPSFFGSNPAEVRIGPRKGIRVLALEDDYGYDIAAVQSTAPGRLDVFDSNRSGRDGALGLGTGVHHVDELQELPQADHAVGDSHHAHGSILRQNSDRLQRSTPVDRDGVPGSRTTE